MTARPPTGAVVPAGTRTVSSSTTTVTASGSIAVIRTPRPRMPSRVPDGSPETVSVHTSLRQFSELEVRPPEPDVPVELVVEDVEVLDEDPTETELPLQPETASSRPASSSVRSGARMEASITACHGLVTRGWEHVWSAATRGSATVRR